MIPVYIFYSMFGFQRAGDLTWTLGDQMGGGSRVPHVTAALNGHPGRWSR